MEVIGAFTPPGRIGTGVPTHIRTILCRTMPKSVPQSLIRRLPLIALALAAVAGLFFLGDRLNLQTLEQNRERLLGLRDDHLLLASLAFILSYIAVILTSLPGALIMTLTGGFVFGLFPGVLYNVLSAWIGASLFFLAVRTGLGRETAARMSARGGAIGRLHAALLDNEWSVLLSMRLIPVLPFFITNTLPAIVGVRYFVFAVTTFIGIIPAAVIYTSLGAGLGEVFERGELPQLDIVLEPRFLFPLLGLAALSFLPFLMRLFRRARP